jgi:hypothetical protein
MSKSTINLNAEELSLSKHIATRMLDMRLDFNKHGQVELDVGGQKWHYPTETDAMALMKFNLIGEALGYYVSELIKKEILKWVAQNKQSLT